MDNTQANTEYNGWTNWDTWNLNLWLNNEEWIYKHFRWIRSLDDFEEQARGIVEQLNNMEYPEGIDANKVNYEEIFEGFQEE